MNRALARCTTAGVFAVWFLAASAPAARAQSNPQQLAEANRSAMEAYNNLDVESAKAALEKAVRNAEKNGIRGPSLARTYANLAVVLVGGLGDQRGAVNAFTRALKEDPKVEPDPLVATPEVLSAFSTAKESAGARAPAPAAEEPMEPEPSAPPPAPRPAPVAAGPIEGDLDHTPAAEQLSQTPIPVFVRVDEDSPIETIKIFYRSLGMDRPQAAALQEVDGGFAYLIPCRDVFEPAVEYFLVAVDDDDKRVGYAGTAENPIAVPIVTARTQRAPSLPGQPPPSRCSADDECPPGMPGCRGSAGLGDTCQRDADCQGGMICSDDFCSLGDREEGEEESSTRGKRFFIDVNFGVGMTAVSEGRAPDRIPTGALVDQIAMSSQRDGAIDAEVAESALRAEGWQCDTSLTPEGQLSVRNCTVAVDPGGLVTVPVLNIAAGYYLTPKLALALTARIQTTRGEGPLAGLLAGARADYLLTKPSDKGLRIGLLTGIGVGQIQARPPSSVTNAGPYATNGNLGGLGVSVALGARAGYRFMKNLGINITPAANIAFPNLLFALDLTAGVEAAF